MNDEESDIEFKVQEEYFPAHKKVLIKKSRYFASLFKSSMAKTRQKVIEIKDCDSVVFQEFLRFIYRNKIDFDDELLAFELREFADKHAQNDLKERCLDYLKSNINSQTVLPIFEKACVRNLQSLVTYCVIYFEDKITLDNISEIVQSLIKNHIGYPREFRDKVLDWIIENYFGIYEKQNQSLRLCEEFLVKNIEIETIPRISEFLAGDSDWTTERKSFIKSYQLLMFRGKSWSQSDEEYEKAERKAKEVFNQETMKLRGAIYFMKESWKEMVKEKEIGQDIPNDLFNMISLALETPDPENLMETISFALDCDDESAKNTRGRKRKEPVKKESETTENPELKKTKK